MPQGEFYDLGKEPTRANDIGMPDKKIYPSLYLDNMEDYPGLADMKIKDIGQAHIKFKIKAGCLEIQSIKFLDAAAIKEEMDESGESPKKPKTRNVMDVMGG